MSLTISRQLSDAEKREVLELHKHKCFATGHKLESDDIQFDHIKAFADKGATGISNIAPMCGEHNRQKGRLSLYDFRTRLGMKTFFDSINPRTLKDHLRFQQEQGAILKYGQNIIFEVTGEEKGDEKIRIELKEKQHTYTIYNCPTTGLKYFYGVIPVEFIDSDDDKDDETGLQPRYLIFDKVFNLFRHFQQHPVLQPSIGRIRDNRVLIFDGQHKISAQLWGGRRTFECKLYIRPDTTALSLLNKTNISAHDNFAQTRFYSSVLVAKLGSQFGKQFEEYKNIEDGKSKTEAGFMNFLRSDEQLKTGDLTKRFRSFLYNTVLENDANKLSRLVSKANRSSADTPLTIDMLEKSFFSNFLYRSPLDTDMATSVYMRATELDNLVTLFNILDEEALCRWDSEKSQTRKTKRKSKLAIDPTQNRLDRMLRSKSIMAWSEIVHAAVCGVLKLHEDEERVRPLYRKLTDDQWKDVRMIIRNLAEWNLWRAPENSEIDRILADNKSTVKAFMKDKNLTSGYLMGAAG